MCPKRKCIRNRPYGDNPLTDIEKKVFDSSEIWESFGIEQKGKRHDRHHQSDKNPKADEEYRRAAKLLLYPITTHIHG